MEKKILDVTCGSRTIWFNKHHPAAIYCDKRRESMTGIWKSTNRLSERTCIVDPDVICDFTDLPFEDNTFSLVVFDPPHLKNIGENSWTYKKYGRLDENWPKMLHDGFWECMRVLKPDGILIFKWAETQIPAAEVWKAIGQKPLFGHHSGKKMGTFWACFMKFEKMEMLEESMPNDPLTIEQLREMDGEPVYIIASDMGIAEWNVIAGKDWITVAYDVPRNGFKAVVEGVGFINGRAFRIDSYGTDWFAYRRPPEGDADA